MVLCSRIMNFASLITSFKTIGGMIDYLKESEPAIFDEATVLLEDPEQKVE